MIGSERNGGADALLAFLIETLRPEIAARYPQTDGAEQILFGHSLGGLFAAHALLTRPGAFDAFLVSSPSLYRSEEHTSELQSLMRISYAVFGLKQRNTQVTDDNTISHPQHATISSANQ